MSRIGGRVGGTSERGACLCDTSALTQVFDLRGGGGGEGRRARVNAEDQENGAGEKEVSQVPSNSVMKDKYHES